MTNLEKALAKAKPGGDGSKTALNWLEPAGNLMAYRYPSDDEPRVLILAYTKTQAVQAQLADWRKVADLDGWTPE